jgi:hypothetical protein
MTSHVFLGPTLPVARAAERLDATFHPPVQQGDVLAALESGASAIGIVDGYFELVPSVWHKEILLALEHGVAVYGAASMGALRAAELHRFGMVGIGRVFEWFRSGRLEDDDEVAVTHGPPEFGYPALSEAMVNIRDLLEAAVAAGAISLQLHDVLIGLAKGLHYSERAYPRLLALARGRGLDEDGLVALDVFRAGHGPSLKERDAIAMLDAMAHPPDRPGVLRDWQLERTIFFEALRQEVQVRAAAAPAPVGETVDVARKKTLLRLLARREAARGGIELPFAEVQAASDGFREHFGLTTADATEGWLRTAGLTSETFRELMLDAALITRLERELAAELDDGLVDQARLSSVRLWARDWV